MRGALRGPSFLVQFFLVKANFGSLVPPSYRASVWRKLEAVDAVYLQSGVAVLPANP